MRAGDFGSSECAHLSPPGTSLALRVPWNFSFAHFIGYSHSKAEIEELDQDAQSFAHNVLEESERSAAAKFLWFLLMKLLDYRKPADVG